VESSFSSADNVEIYSLINEIDTIVNFVILGKDFDCLKNYHHYADSYLNKLKSLLLDRAKGDNELRDVLILIFNEASVLVERYIINMSANDDFSKCRNESFDHLIKDSVALMESQGFLEFQLPQTDEFEQWCKIQMVAAKKQYENESDWRGANAYASTDSGYGIIKNFIKENRILEILSAYKKMNMSFFYAAWDYSHNRQKWFRNNHEYNHISPTNYYHFDADEDVSKMLIYLSDVSAGDGAFKVVKSSNVHSRSVFLTYAAYVIDTQISSKFRHEDNLYGRGLFLYRKDLLLKFPEAFMTSTHFGDDLEEGSALSNFLLDNTVTFERKKGTAVLFDGYNVIHAGGNADKGERLAVQIAFKRDRSFNTPVSVPLKQRIKGLIKSFLKKQ
jgi:hypothetical protein